MTRRFAEVTARLDGLAYGGDYNPEQWPEDVWVEDVALMREAGVNLVTVGVFSWARLEVAEGSFDFGWLDRILDLLHDAGIAVDLATATASPPPWFSERYPHTLPVDADGVVRWYGGRQAYCPSAPDYRAATQRMAATLAKRYGEHPAVVMWHVNNEYGCHTWHCWCDASATAFRAWLQERYGTLDALNHAWGTAFWSQHYTAWTQVMPPRTVPNGTFANPTQQLDWWRFGSDELLACFQAEADTLRSIAPQPVTTNFMSFHKPTDYWAWAQRQDLVSNDDYLIGADPNPTQLTAMSADLMRSLAGGAPWLLMEHSTSAVNWQPRNRAKAPGQLARNSLQHLARGADGALFFQWRASRAGAEKFHSGLVPHAGRDSRVWREVVEFGSALRALAPVAGTRVAPAQVAIAYDWQSRWAAELQAHPSADAVPVPQLRAWHEQLWSRNVGVDFVHPDGDLSGYRLVVLPVGYLLTDGALANLAAFVEGGGCLLVTFFSGIVDEHDHVRLGGYPGEVLRDVLGLRIEEFYPLLTGEDVELSAFGCGTIWSERAAADGAEVLASYTAGPVAGSPAVTRHGHGSGRAYYIGTALDADGSSALLDLVLDDAGVHPVLDGLPQGVEALRRVGDDGSFLFVINHTDEDVALEVGGVDLRTSGPVRAVPAGGWVVVSESASGAAS